jgi:hypothetical protein
VRQEPQHGVICTADEKRQPFLRLSGSNNIHHLNNHIFCFLGWHSDARKALVPFPIIQLIVNDDGRTRTHCQENAFYFMHAALTDADNDDEIARTTLPDVPVTNSGYVSSVQRFKDVDERDGSFFCFQDLSIRIEGTFRLKFNLFEVAG